MMMVFPWWLVIARAGSLPPTQREPALAKLVAQLHIPNITSYYYYKQNTQGMNMGADLQPTPPPPTLREGGCTSAPMGMKEFYIYLFLFI